MSRFTQVIKSCAQTSVALFLLVHISTTWGPIVIPTSIQSLQPVLLNKDLDRIKLHLLVMLALPASPIGRSQNSCNAHVSVLPILSWGLEAEPNMKIHMEVIYGERKENKGSRTEKGKQSQGAASAGVWPSSYPLGTLEQGLLHRVAPCPFWGKGSFCAPASVRHWLWATPRGRRVA